nr:hypothetical protein [Tanacetum cinerariifolium]
MTIDTNVTAPVNMAIEDVILSHYFEPYAPRRRAANCKMPKRMNPRKANMVNDNIDMIAMVSDIISMISKVNLVDSNNS